MEILLLMVVFIGLMYVLMVLPQKRKMDAQRKMLSALEPGARVMLNTGMFGTIRASGNQQMVVELAPGVEVTVLKQAVVRTVTAQEEEFEYADGDQAIEPGDSFSADDFAALDAPGTDTQAGYQQPAEPPLTQDRPITDAPPAGPSFAPAAADVVSPVDDEDDRRQNR